jgi:hypothetical protein
MVPISKTTFLQFQVCNKDTWFRLHRPDLVEKFAPTEFEKHLLEQGNEVEAFARRLFPEGVLVTETGDQALAQTQALMESGATAVFQATFLADGFYTKCDVLKRSTKPGAWDIFEVKGTNSLKEGGEDRDHISDLAFQRHVLRFAGVAVDRAYVVHLNKEYVRSGDLDTKALFSIVDSTDLVDEESDEILEEMRATAKYLNQGAEPDHGCDCHLNGRSRHCRTFAQSHPEIPEYSVHDIVRIGQSKKKLAELVTRKLYMLDAVPNNFKLGDAQTLQVQVYKSGRPLIDRAAIKVTLGEYKFPLHFLDYETYAPAIPTFDGYSPYRKIPFQFSLHVLRTVDSELEHFEYLCLERTDPTLAVAELLDRHIDENGTVVVWHAPFERGVNKEIGDRLPSYAARMEAINSRVKDLRDIFSKQHYVHPEFRGSTSIKSVMPVLVPELSYDDLAIQDGTSASEQWWQMTAPNIGDEERGKIAQALREYCGQDSYAMYAIWRHLMGLSEAAHMACC